MKMGSIKFHYHKSLRNCNNPNSKWSFWFVFLNQAIFNLDIFCVNLRIHTYYSLLLLQFLFCIICSEKIQKKHICFFSEVRCFIYHGILGQSNASKVAFVSVINRIWFMPAQSAVLLWHIIKHFLILRLLLRSDLLEV